MTYTQTKWNLADLYPGFNTPELESAYDNIEEQVTSFEGLRSNLTPDMPADRFLDVVRASEEMTRVAHRLYSFGRASNNFWRKWKTAPCFSACGGRTWTTKMPSA